MANKSLWKNNNGIHLSSADGNDVTLCGDALDEDCSQNAHGPIKELPAFSHAVTCDHCLEIVRYCRELPLFLPEQEVLQQIRFLESRVDELVTVAREVARKIDNKLIGNIRKGPCAASMEASDPCGALRGRIYEALESEVNDAE